VASLARAALLSAYSNIPLDRRDIEPAPGEWSPRRQLSHVAGSEVWYADALVRPGEGTQVDLPPDPVAALGISAAHIEAVLRSLSPEAAGHVIERDGEQWTAAKVIRRMVGHLREHYQDLAAS
jgi:hypothetical protein